MAHADRRGAAELIRSHARCAAAGAQAQAPALRACKPKARREHSLRAIAAARKALAAQAAAGNDPRGNAAVNRARGEAISEGHRRNRSWAREHPGQRDEAWYKREIAPKLDGFTLKEIGGGDGVVARSLLAHPGWHESAASEALAGAERLLGEGNSARDETRAPWRPSPI